MGTSLKGKNLLPEGANSFHKELFLKVWKITYTTLDELPWVLFFLLRTCVYRVMGAMPMMQEVFKLASSSRTILVLMLKVYMYIYQVYIHNIYVN